MDRWCVDECPDANGYWTIRPATAVGRPITDKQPIATVYSEDFARQVVMEHNEVGELRHKLSVAEERYYSFLKEVEAIVHKKI